MGAGLFQSEAYYRVEEEVINMEYDFSQMNMQMQQMGMDYNQGYGNMPQMDMNYNQGYGNMGYGQGYGNMPQMNMYNGQGYYGMQQMQPIHYSKSQIIDVLRSFLQQSTNVAVSGEDKIEETPNELRHACAPWGVSFLQRCDFPVPEMGITVPFYFCKSCGKLFYLKDFM